MALRLPILLVILASMGMLPLYATADRFDQSISHGDEKIHVTLIQKPFVASEHTISKKHWKIDGVTPLGVDAFEVGPTDGIGNFKITWNGHEIPVPEELYRDCFMANLTPSDPISYVGKKRKMGNGIAAEGTMLHWNDAEGVLEIIMVSSRWASAPYFVVWKITPYGVSSREAIRLGP